MANIELLWWWALLLLPLPLVIYRFLPPVKERAAIHLPYLPKQDQISSPRNIAIKAIATAIWCLLILAVARPVWYGDPVTTQPKHRDLMLVVDLSYSMSQEDMQQGGQYIDRLTAVKNVLSDFIQKREGDRLGLVLFADHAYLQTPLTLDKNTISEQLNQAVLKLIGTQTAIGEGIGLATKTFIDSDAPQRVMILLSDGSNTSGVLDPLEAAKIAKKYDATIYTIGVGAGEMMVKEFFMTRKVNTAQDLDEKTLTEIANITGGKYFRARNSQDLANIYDTINQLEPISQATQTWRPQTEWFGYPLLAALMLSVILIVLRRNHV
ncbi:VWA domain-containing protein [Vibrio aestuarianus]|uniref:VWA domain-containing protein n=1 Tax=Vibrio aestuarianus TaxID=28171 RepID=A0ABD7YRG7_9VIBR|nr:MULTISPECIES: VWA domain-containing protein [Vibrio]KOE81524.1 IMP dehydrogenase [Vibrio alginolyticus]MBD1566899.1 VWA domain-containing protein [Vibrio sp. S12_S33]MDE1209910.1 VWA domain-containing protein [Vibrio aestuarianus]MDE1221860.1 VWA domain-containing protein [Vibrio aestuarianus]MDE1224816.1 VWA domain-containing protein [Vibrio aestuarianus]